MGEAAKNWLDRNEQPIPLRRIDKAWRIWYKRDDCSAHRYPHGEGIVR